jgi:hypothetical protein
MTQKVLTKRKEYNMDKKEFDHDWFDKHVIVDFGDFNNKEDKKKADDLKDKLKQKLEEEFRDESISQ